MTEIFTQIFTISEPLQITYNMWWHQKTIETSAQQISNSIVQLPSKATQQLTRCTYLHHWVKN